MGESIESDRNGLLGIDIAHVDVIYIGVRTTHDAEKSVRDKWRFLMATMDERQRRLWAGAEADAICFGGHDTIELHLSAVQITIAG